MIDEPKQKIAGSYGNSQPTSSQPQDNYPQEIKPAPKKDCHCGPNAPCRKSGICDCDVLKGLVKKVEEE
jgi:hypothetical protein